MKTEGKNKLRKTLFEMAKFCYAETRQHFRLDHSLNSGQQRPLDQVQRKGQLQIYLLFNLIYTLNFPWE